MHPDVLTWSVDKRKLFVSQIQDRLKKMNETLLSSLQPATLLNEATYQLRMTVVKHHKPVSYAEKMVNRAGSCDLDSCIFKIFPKSRQTNTRRIIDLANFIEHETISGLQGAQPWGLLMDESTDSADHAQAILYVRYPDVTKEAIVTKFLIILRVEGSPTANNLFSNVNAFIETKSIKKENVVSFTSDGASVMCSLGKGVAGFLRRNYNLNLFAVFASKDGLSKLPTQPRS